SVKKKYNNMLRSGNLKKCPDYWGGYYFSPFYFEFWEGHDSRLNKREVFELVEGEWSEYMLEP
ncbi:pyridoxamine 5'-phosphate oxidase, partial [Gammaproteobacteria bacterium]|nr:pyridoxamine 5'-phosphate oxidase [Gammaproteobacteria bacterium]